MSRLEAATVDHRTPVTAADARQLAELARAAGLGEAPDDALRWNTQALELLGTSGNSPLLVDVLRWQGSVLRDRGRTSEAHPLYARSLEIAAELGYDEGVAHALNCFASLAQRRGNITAASNLITDALSAAQRCGDRRLVGMLQQNLGMMADIRGNPAAARAHYCVSLRSFEASNDRQPMSWVLNNIAILHIKEERYGEACIAIERALSISRTTGDLMAEGVLEENRAELELIRGAIDDAYQPANRAMQIAQQRGDDLRRAAALKLRGAYQRLCGRPSEAVDTLQYALTLSAVAEDALLGAEVLYQFGLALAEDGQGQAAHEVWNAALDAFERIAARPWVTRTRQRLSTGTTGRYF